MLPLRAEAIGHGVDAADATAQLYVGFVLCSGRGLTLVLARIIEDVVVKVESIWGITKRGKQRFVTVFQRSILVKEERFVWSHE